MLAKSQMDLVTEQQHKVLFKASVSLIFCLDDMTIDVNEVLKSSIITVCFPHFVNIFFIYFVVPMWSICICLQLLHFLVDICNHIYYVYDLLS